MDLYSLQEKILLVTFDSDQLDFREFSIVV
jgi:hypothetical protein